MVSELKGHFPKLHINVMAEVRSQHRLLHSGIVGEKVSVQPVLKESRKHFKGYFCYLFLKTSPGLAQLSMNSSDSI